MTILMPEPWQLDALRRLMTRLHSENRMSGEEMRDAGHLIDAILRSECDLDPDA